MKETIRKLLKRERAQTMVEFALVFPVLLLIVYGMIEFGRIMLIYTAVTTASREGARYGAAVGYPAHYSDCANIIATAINRGGFLAGITAGDITIGYDRPNNDSAAEGDVNPPQYDSTCPPNQDVLLGDRIVVMVQTTYQPIISMLGLDPLPITVTTKRTIIKDLEIDSPPNYGVPPSATVANPATQTAAVTATYWAGQTATAAYQTQQAYTPTASPTVTQTPTITPTPTVTLTPTITRTPTQTPDCVIQSVSIYKSGNSIVWEIRNNGAQATMNPLTVTWETQGNRHLVALSAGGSSWSGDRAISPWTCNGCWSGGNPVFSPGGPYLITSTISSNPSIGVHGFSATFTTQSGGTCSAGASITLP